jgi:response regulator RpfG family c-di-GMP phosphodiesterase
VRTAYDLDRLVVDDTTGADLLPADLSYRVAIPFRSRRGAFLVQPWAGGEHLDIESVAAASAIARTAELLDRQHALTTEIDNLRREEIESAIAGDDLERPVFAMVPSRAAAVDVFQRVEALRTLKRLADQACHSGLAHSDAVAERAVRIATSMQLDHDAVLAIQLAGELHEIGTLLGADEELCEAAMVALAGTMIRACGLPEAATIVESMYEQFDGSWIPLGRAGEKIPIGSRILAVADDLETALEGRSGDEAIEAAVMRLEAQSGGAFDPRVVQVALRTREQ